MPDNPQGDVTIRTKVEGVSESLSALGQLRQALERLNAPAGGLPGVGAGTMPSSAPGSAPPPPDPYGSYRTPSGPGPQYPHAPSAVGSPLTLALPMGGGGGGVPPGHYAPSAPGGYRALPGGSTVIPALSPIGSMGTAGGGMPANVTVAQMNVQANEVRIIAQTVSTVSGGGIGGGGIGGGGGGAIPLPFGGGGGGGIQPSWSNFAQMISKNPTPAGLMNAIMHGLPIGPVAVAGALGEIANLAQGSYVAYQAPQFAVETGLMAAAMSGQFVHPALQAAQMAAAQTRGRLGAVQVWARPGESIPLIGGLIRGWNELQVYQPLERQAAMQEAAGSRNLLRSYLAGLSVPLDMGDAADPLLGVIYQHARGVRAFGTAARRGAASDIDINPGLYRGMIRLFGESGALDAAGAVAQLGYQPAYGDIRAGLMGGMSPRTLAPAAAAYYAALGNLGAIESLRPYLGGTTADQYARQAAGVLDTINQMSIAGSRIGEAQAGLLGLRVTGASWQQVVGGIGSVGGRQADLLSALYLRRSQVRTEADRAAIDAQIAQVEAEIAAVPLLQTQEEIGARTTFLEVGRGSALLGTQRALYGGDAAGVAAGYGRQIGEANRRARAYREFARLPGLTPQDRARYGLMSEQAQFEANVLLPREHGQFAVGVMGAEVGVVSAGATSAYAQAQLFGGPGAIYSAGMGQVGAIQQQSALTQWQLTNARSLGLTPQEELNLQRQLIDLKREEVVVTQQVVRGYATMNVQIAQIGQAITGTQVSRGFLLGAGGGAAFPMAAQTVGAAQNRLAQAQKRVAMLREQGVAEDNPEMQQALLEMEQAQTGVEQARLGLTQIPMPVNLRRAQRAAEFMFNVTSRTYLPWGNMRGQLANMMNLAGQELQEINRIEAQMARAGLLDDAARELLEMRRYEVGNRLIGYQQQYETGWQDRLISSVYNAPGNFSLVASRFTMREAAPFLQAISPMFGFTNAAARDHYMFRFPRLANSLIGNIQRPEGFMQTAVSGVLNPPAPREQVLRIEVIIKDSSGNEIGRGSTTKAMHDLNQVLDIIGNRFANPSHQ